MRRGLAPLPMLAMQEETLWTEYEQQSTGL
jgi:hypothetical protein